MPQQPPPPESGGSAPGLRAAHNPLPFAQDGNGDRVIGPADFRAVLSSMDIGLRPDKVRTKTRPCARRPGRPPANLNRYTNARGISLPRGRGVSGEDGGG